MDTFRAHLHVNVLRTCSRLGLLLMFIPAEMTGWLQPLDVAVFGKYKDWVVRQLARRRITAGSLSRVQVLTVYAEGIRAVIDGRSWQGAFEVTGLRSQTNLSKQLLARLECEAPPVVPPALPSAVDLLAVYPRRAIVPVDEVFAGVLRMASARPQPLFVLPRRARLTAVGVPPPPLPPPAGAASRRRMH